MRNFLSTALLLATSACAGQQGYVPPKGPVDGQQAFVTPLPGSTSAVAPDEQWWRIYDDPALAILIEHALRTNTDLRVALANLKAAQAVVDEVDTHRLPRTGVNAQALYGRTQPPLYLPGNRATGSAGIEFSYELDLFGRVGRTIAAARADAESAAFARSAVQVRVAASVTDAYLSACTAAEAIADVKTTINLAAASTRLVGLREHAGSAGSDEVARAEARSSETRAMLAPYEHARRAALYELAALLGTTPAHVPAAAVQCTAAPDPHRPIPIGDVAGLLKRRPDVGEAERRLAAATARLGVAMADLYPSIRLGASVTQAGGEGISQARGFVFGVGPLLNFTFPANGAARARVRQSEARNAAALAAFDGTVITAIKEAEQSLGAYDAALRRRDALAATVRETDRAYTLATLRYRAGSIAYLDVIAARSELMRTRLGLVEQDRAAASSLVKLFRALGGGWTPDPQASAVTVGNR